MKSTKRIVLLTLSDSLIDTVTFLLLVFPPPFFKEKVCDGTTNCDITSKRTWIRTGGCGQLRGKWVHFAIFPQSGKT